MTMYMGQCRYGSFVFLFFHPQTGVLFWPLIDATSAASCLNITKWFAKHTGMTLLRKEVPLCFPGSQGRAGMPYRSIPFTVPLRALDHSRLTYLYVVTKTEWAYSLIRLAVHVELLKKPYSWCSLTVVYLLCCLQVHVKSIAQQKVDWWSWWL